MIPFTLNNLQWFAVQLARGRTVNRADRALVWGHTPGRLRCGEATICVALSRAELLLPSGQQTAAGIRTWPWFAALPKWLFSGRGQDGPVQWRKCG